MAASSLLVWDLDLTLGRFDALERGVGELQLRPDIGDALDALTAEGCVHVLLTLSSPTYAGLALTGAGLLDRFAAVHGRGEMAKGDAVSVARDFDITEDERPHRMLFVGDHPLFDPPRDPRVVFHLETAALTRSAHDAARLILALRARGDGSFARGAERLLRRRWWAGEWGSGARRRRLPDLDPLLIARRDDGLRIVAFEGAPSSPKEGQRLPIG